MKDGKDVKMFVMSCSVFKLCKFKMIVGLVSFLVDMGCFLVNILLIVG